MAFTPLRLRNVALCLLFAVWALTGTVQSAPQSTAFTFQGTLSNSTGPLTGVCDFQFRLYDSESSSNQLGSVNNKPNVALINGFFTITLDFGAVYNGAVRWLETQVRCPASSENYTLLAPRQAVRPTPYALYAEHAQSVAGADGDFTATGDLRSARQPGVGDVGGALVLENSTTKNSWTSAIRATDSDRLSFDFWDENLKNWRFGARLDRDSNFFLQGTVFTNGLDANTIVSHGYLESKRTPSGIAPNNGGTLVLENSQSGNKWEIPVRADNADSLYFNFWNATQGAWWGAAVLSSTGTLAINHNSMASSTLLSLDHPKAGWRFHVDNAGHAEVGIYDAVRKENRWNVLDIDPATGHVGVGMSASPEYRFMVYDQATISTGYTGNKTLLQLHHPIAQWHFHFDNNGHPEVMVKDVANDRFTFNVLDIDPATGHVGIGGDATAGDRLRINGNFTATGTKAATVDAGRYGQRKLYAVEAADVRFSDEGLAQLVAGVARVDLDPIFLATIEGPYLVHVTPYGDASLYVAERGAGYFIVKAREGDPAAEFAWRLSAKRKGYADVRLEPAGQP
jgi:hypothetical protein